MCATRWPQYLEGFRSPFRILSMYVHCYCSYVSSLKIGLHIRTLHHHKFDGALQDSNQLDAIHFYPQHAYHHGVVSGPLGGSSDAAG